MKIYYVQSLEADSDGIPLYPAVALFNDASTEMLQVLIDPPDTLTPQFSKYSVNLVDPLLFNNFPPSFTFSFNYLKGMSKGYLDMQTWMLSGRYVDNIFRFNVLPSIWDFFSEIASSTSVVLFNIPLSTSSYNDCFVLVRASSLQAEGDSIDLENITLNYQDGGVISPFINSKFPSISLSCSDTLTLSTPATVNINLLDNNNSVINSDMEIYLQNVNGYLPYNRVILDAGVGSFKVMALGMATGDTIRIKAGTKQVTGLSEISLNVVG